MYQFTTTNIINSALDSNGVTAKYSGTTTVLNIPRVGNFKKDNIVSVYKRAYSVGIKEVATVTVPTIAAGKVAQLLVNIKLEQSANAEYGNVQIYFQKPVIVEVIATGNFTTDATNLVKQLNSLKDRFGSSYITATSSGATITLTAKDNNQRLNAVKVSEEDTSVNTIIDPQYKSVATGTVTVAGKLGFGDDEYMLKSIRIPTIENNMPYGIAADERPVLGGNYTQYTLRYSIDKQSDGILSGFKSVTTHVFYVLSSLVTAFEAEVEKTFPGIVTVGTQTGAGAFTITGDDRLKVGEKTTLVANTPGTIAWGTSAAGTATVVAGTGVVTGVAAGTVTMTGTASPSGKVATFVITITA